MTALRTSTRLVFPEGLLLIGLLAVPRTGAFERLLPFATVVAAAALVTTVAVGWRFGRGRVVHGALLLGLAAAVPSLPPGPARVLAARLIPLDLALLAALPDRGVLSRGGLARLGGLGVQIVGIAWLAAHATPASATAPAILARFPGLGPIDPAAIAYLAALPTLALLGHREPEAIRRGLLWVAVAILALHLGLAGGPAWAVVGGAVVLLVATLEEAHGMAYRDGLTGLPSRRALDEQLQRLGGRYTIAMVDVDRFKAFNDRHGHEVGDQVLRMVAARLRETKGARAYRYGGEEFTLVFRRQSLDRVKAHLDRVRERVAEPAFVLRSPDRPAKKPRGPRRALRLLPRRPERQTLAVTVSIGVAQRESRSQSPGEVVAAADQALYRAKKRGRNRVVA